MKPALALLGSAYLLGTVLQHVLGAGLLHGNQLSVFAAGTGLVAFSLVVAAGWRRKWLGFFSSNRFAVPVIFSLTALSIVGTLILQNQPEQVLRQAYGWAATAIHALLLDDIFHSLGFSAAIGLGAGGLALVVARKRRWSLRTLGSLGVHVGLLLILAGAAVGNVWGSKGRLDMHTGESSDRFFVALRDATLALPLGFVVRLDEFRLEHYEPEYRLMVFELNGEEERRLASVDPASSELAPLRELGVEPLDYWPDHFVETIVEPGDAEGGAETSSALGLKRERDGDGVEWIFDDGAAGGGRLVIGEGLLVFVWERHRAERLVESLGAAPAGPRHVILASGQEIPVEIGKTYRIPGTAHRLEVLRSLEDFVIDTASREPKNRSDEPNNPAIEVGVRDSQGKLLGRSWLFAKFPDFHGMQDSPAAGLGYRYVPAAGREQVDWIIVGEARELWTISEGAPRARSKFEVGGQIRLGKTSRIVVSLLESARREFTNKSRSDRANNPLVLARIEGQRSTILLKPKQPVRLPDGKVLVLAPKGGDTVRDYLSVLSVFDNGRKVLTKTVEVNDPLEYGGFSLYQSDYRPDDPTFSGFQVVSDPGLGIVYLGFGIHVAGVFCAVLLPPIIRRRKAARTPRGEPG